MFDRWRRSCRPAEPFLLSRLADKRLTCTPTDLFATSQIDKIEVPALLASRIHIPLMNGDQEDGM
jgi:hypothetical protein